MRRAWTTTEVRQLEDMRKRRMPVADIALTLNRSEDSIYAFLRYVPGSGRRHKAIERVGRAPKPSPSESLRLATVRAIIRHAQATGSEIHVAAHRLLNQGVA